MLKFNGGATKPPFKVGHVHVLDGLSFTYIIGADMHAGV